MSLVALLSGRSPGLTTTIHALAATWPGPRCPIVAELDPAGGSLAARYELPPEPGLTNLAAAGRRGLNSETVLRHCRRLPSGVLSLVAPVSADLVASALAVLGSDLAPALDSIPGTDVLADCGRIERRSPAADVVRAARYVVLVVTPSLEGVAHAQAGLETLDLAAGRLALVTIGDRPFGPEEVGAALNLPVLGTLAHDPGGVARLDAGRPLRRGDLRHSASAIARDLVRVLTPVDPVQAAPPAVPAHDLAPPPEPRAAGAYQAPAPPSHSRPRRPPPREPGPVAGAAAHNSRP